MSVRAVAARAGLNEPAVRLWCRRFRQRAEVAVAVVAVIAAGLGGAAGVAASSAEAVLSALKAVVAVMCETEGLERWSAISVWTGGMWLAPLDLADAPGSRVFQAAAERRLMTMIDPNEPKRPP